MKKILIGLILLAGAYSPALAAEETFDKAYQNFLSSGIVCSTGAVATEIVAHIEASTGSVLKGYNLGGWRIQNQDSTYSVWLNNSSSVSTTTVSVAQKANLGEKLIAGANGVWPLSRDQYANTNIYIYCRAEDSAGASGITLSVAAFGYR